MIVESTIEMAHRLGLKVVAEGVETAEQLDWLAGHGCDLTQGYHVSRPLTGPALEQWMTEHRAPSAVPAQSPEPAQPGNPPRLDGRSAAPSLCTRSPAGSGRRRSGRTASRP